MAESDYLMYVLITDRQNNRLYEWRRGKGNLVLGLKVTAAFIEDKLGVPLVLLSPNGQNGKNEIHAESQKAAIQVKAPESVVPPISQASVAELIERIKTDQIFHAAQGRSHETAREA